MRTVLNGDNFKAGWCSAAPDTLSHYFKQATMNQAESLCSFEFRKIETLTPASTDRRECGLCRKLLNASRDSVARATPNTERL